MAYEAQLERAIRGRQVVRLGYERQKDGLITLHFVAPIDVRPGETAKTSGITYLWAYCFDEGRLETHLMSHIRSVSATGEVFDATLIEERWPATWSRPAFWVVSREW